MNSSNATAATGAASNPVTNIKPEPPAHLPENLPALGAEVAIGDIERSLEALWDADNAAARASLINFAVYSRDPSLLLENTDTISAITREHACRAILLLSPPGAGDTASVTPGAPPITRAWITAHCNLNPDGGKFACSEQVTFLLENATPAVNQNVLYAHLDSDLPLVVWWQGSLLNDHFEERLYSGIDRLILDSTNWEDPLTGFRALETAMAAPASRFITHDLAWTRGRPFRLAFASAFDHPAAREKLASATSLEIHVQTGQFTTGLFLLAWIANQDGWSLQAGDRRELGSDFQFTRESAPPVLASIHMEDSCAPLASLALSGGAFRLTITRECSAPLLHREMTCDSRQSSHILPAEADDNARLIASVLSRTGQNRLFAKSLSPAINLLQALPSCDTILM